MNNQTSNQTSNPTSNPTLTHYALFATLWDAMATQHLRSISVHFDGANDDSKITGVDAMVLYHAGYPPSQDPRVLEHEHFVSRVVAQQPNPVDWHWTRALRSAYERNKVAVRSTSFEDPISTLPIVAPSPLDLHSAPGEPHIHGTGTLHDLARALAWVLVEAHTEGNSQDGDRIYWTASYGGMATVSFHLYGRAFSDARLAPPPIDPTHALASIHIEVSTRKIEMVDELDLELDYFGNTPTPNAEPYSPMSTPIAPHHVAIPPISTVEEVIKDDTE